VEAQSFRPMYESGTLEFVEDVVFGSDDDEDEGVLYGPIDFSVDNEGNVFVLDYQLLCIKKFNRKGEHVKTLSRSGQGPGELARPRNMTVTPKGNVVVFDLTGHRFSVFGNDGEIVDIHRFQGGVRQLVAAPDESIVTLFRFLDSGWERKGALYKIIRFSPDLRTNTDIDSAYVKVGQVVYESDESLVNVRSPYVERPYFAIAPNGELIIGHSKEYVLRVLTPELEVIHRIDGISDRIKVTEEDKKKYFDSFKHEEPNMQIMVKNNVKFPKYKPAFKAISVDHEGYILVDIYDEATVDNASVFDVYTGDGNFINQVEFRNPGGLKDGYAYSLRITDDELPKVVRFKPGAVSMRERR
jgi:hypothetical protein